MTCEYSLNCGNGCGSCNYTSGSFNSEGYASTNYTSQSFQLNYSSSPLRGNYKND